MINDLDSSCLRKAKSNETKKYIFLNHLLSSGLEEEEDKSPRKKFENALNIESDLAYLSAENLALSL